MAKITIKHYQQLHKRYIKRSHHDDLSHILLDTSYRLVYISRHRLSDFLMRMKCEIAGQWRFIVNKGSVYQIGIVYALVDTIAILAFEITGDYK